MRSTKYASPSSPYLHVKTSLEGEPGRAMLCNFCWAAWGHPQRHSHREVPMRCLYQLTPSQVPKHQFYIHYAHYGSYTADKPFCSVRTFSVSNKEVQVWTGVESMVVVVGILPWCSVFAVYFPFQDQVHGCRTWRVFCFFCNRFGTRVVLTSQVHLKHKETHLNCLPTRHVMRKAPVPWCFHLKTTTFCDQRLLFTLKMCSYCLAHCLTLTHWPRCRTPLYTHIWISLMSSIFSPY